MIHYAVLATPCQVYPSEYAYHGGSVTRNEPASANCSRYQGGLKDDVFTHNYIHCNGTQLLLADSSCGSKMYNSSVHYEWHNEMSTTSSIQMLFIFPTRVNLTTITLHYYSDSGRGLPRLRFFAVPDDFHVWDATTGSHQYVEIASMPLDGESAGHKMVTHSFNYDTVKVLMLKSKSPFSFAVSEVEFSTCIGQGKYNIPYRGINVCQRPVLCIGKKIKFNSLTM